jgi:hypothetical protein
MIITLHNFPQYLSEIRRSLSSCGRLYTCDLAHMCYINKARALLQLVTSEVE